MKIDPYNHKKRYLEWKEKVSKGIPDISESNSKIIIKYLEDMECGINISVKNVKGSRSYPRLNTLREKTIFFSKKFKERFDIDKITDITEENLMKFFSEINSGKITRKDGTAYKSASDFVKSFKAFWHWHQKVNRKKGNSIDDITIDLDTRKEKPEWVYLTEAQIKKLCDNANYERRVLIMFLFDSGIRSPTELINIKVSDLYNDCKELNIKEEISKTFGRRIKLMLCSRLLIDYIKTKNLSENDYLFMISPGAFNKYLKRLGKKVFGDVKSLAGKKYSELTMYHFRHCSCCYWLPLYKSEISLKYRFGWKKSDKIHYYSEMLGMKDTIQEEDLFVDVTKTEIEKKLEKSEKDKELMQDKMEQMEKQMNIIFEMVKEIGGKVGD